MSNPKTTTTTVDLTTLRNVIESSDEAGVVALYADDAELTIVDRNSTPSKPKVLAGKPAVATYYHDMCARALTHRIEQAVVGQDGIAFIEACRYPDGLRVLSSNLLQLRDGKIARHSLVQAWDE